LYESPTLRLLAIAGAMITDSIDGYLARRSRTESRFGAILDPAMDKFFVYFALSIFFIEGRIGTWLILSMLSRDFFVLLYGIFMVALGRSRSIEFRAIRWGKVTTALQFVILMGLVIQVEFPWGFFAAFAVMGVLAFLELLQLSNPFSPRSTVR
jgi:CDP-diacylglycerol--glycerol-3-phosphate 3-phosphatidyltransferase